MKQQHISKLQMDLLITYILVAHFNIQNYYALAKLLVSINLRIFLLLIKFVWLQIITFNVIVISSSMKLYSGWFIKNISKI